MRKLFVVLTLALFASATLVEAQYLRRRSVRTGDVVKVVAIVAGAQAIGHGLEAGERALTRRSIRKELPTELVIENPRSSKLRGCELLAARKHDAELLSEGMCRFALDPSRPCSGTPAARALAATMGGTVTPRITLVVAPQLPRPRAP